MNDVLAAFLLTLLAGLASGLGGVIAVSSKVGNTKFLSACLSLSAGVMIYISFVEIFAKAYENLEAAWGEAGYLAATLIFFAGIGVAALIDKLVPHNQRMADFVSSASAPRDADRNGPTGLSARAALHRTGLMSALAVSLHNFPEGLVVFVAAMADPALGAVTALAIALHNVPEGIAMAVPIYHATGSKTKALWVSLLSGLTEPLGGILGWLLLSAFFDQAILGISFALAGGIMVFVALHQLLPAARRYGSHHTVMGWLVAGMAIMAASLVALGTAGV